MKPSQRTIQEISTPLAPDEVLQRAKQFFSRHNGVYNTFVDMEGPAWCSFRGQGNEELIIAAAPVDGGSRVTGSTYLFDMQVARFFSTLPTIPGAQPAAAIPAQASTGASA